MGTMKHMTLPGLNLDPDAFELAVQGGREFLHDSGLRKVLWPVSPNESTIPPMAPSVAGEASPRDDPRNDFQWIPDLAYQRIASESR